MRNDPQRQHLTRLFSTTRSTNSQGTHERKRSTASKVATNTAIFLAILAANILVIASLSERDPVQILAEYTGTTDALLRFLHGEPLNTKSFVPFTVISREQVSPSSFMLTIRPEKAVADDDDDEWHGCGGLEPREKKPKKRTLDRHSSVAVLRAAWEHGLWSVEIKQPQLQIARSYTPLPPPPGEDERELAGGVLRFYVRRHGGGEVSGYLSRLRAGDRVELRGPHLGFDVGGRLGAAGRVVFLAGGTGIAPALQVARALAPGGGGGGRRGRAEVSVLWANRGRADCDGCPEFDMPQGKEGFFASFVGARLPKIIPQLGGDERPGPIVQQVRDLERRYNDGDFRGLDLRCVVDEEETRVGAKEIMEAVEGSEQAAASGNINAAQTDACQYHSERVLERCTEESDQDRSNGGCSCAEVTSQATTAMAGKNLFMISGPDGFIKAYAGPKVWAGGAERQGPVGGLVAELQRAHPEAWKNWLVLKL